MPLRGPEGERGGAASGNDRSVADLCTADLVLTTYGTLAREYSRVADAMDGDGIDSADGPREADGGADTAASSLFGVSFHRVVLDEAHMIKSRTTAVARGAHPCGVVTGWTGHVCPLANSGVVR